MCLYTLNNSKVTFIDYFTTESRYVSTFEDVFVSLVFPIVVSIVPFINIIIMLEAGGMVVPEDLGSVFTVHVFLLTTDCKASSRESDAVF